MDSLTLTLVIAVTLFFLLLIVKQALKGKIKDSFCVICLSVSLTWIILLILYFFGKFDNFLIIALMIGMSITGIYYFFEAKVSENFKIFRLPFILLLLTFTYFIIEEFILNAFFMVIGLWVVFIFMFIFRNNKNFSVAVRKLVECCKRW